jgi:HupE / UreJ protein
MVQGTHSLTRLAGVRALVCAGAVALALVGGLLGPSKAAAHFKSVSVVELEVEEHQVTGRVRLPYDMLILLPFPEVGTEAQLVADIRRYAAAHMSVRGANGKAWEVRLSGGHTVQGNGVYELIFGLVLTPPRGEVTDFSVTYDAIIERIPSHRAALIAKHASGDGQVLGFFEPDRRTIEVHAAGGGSSASRFGEFRSAISLGVKHISEGSDHLLFLMMLLLPAPLMLRGGRWVRCDDPRRSALRIVHVVTAFAIGHSITLALAGLGLIHVPERPVEALIALSILVAAIHVLRPLIPSGEAVIAVGFGLVHGLAFASLLGEFDLERGALVFTLLGFNLGIELTQLLVVALVMPSLYLLSRTAVYAPFRIGGGLLGVVLSGSWLLQRTALTQTDPFEFMTNGLIDHPFLFAAGMAVFATAAYLLSSARAPLWGSVQTE